MMRLGGLEPPAGRYNHMATTKFTPNPQTPVKAAGSDINGGLGKDWAANNHNPAKTIHNSDNTAITSLQQ